MYENIRVGDPQTHQTLSTLLPLPSLVPFSSFVVALGVGFFLFRSDQTLDALGFLITDYLGVLFVHLFAISFPHRGEILSISRNKSVTGSASVSTSFSLICSFSSACCYGSN